MEANTDNTSSQSQSQELEDEDRLSTLTDDILLSILGRVSLRIAASTCVLSTRWRHLPWLLPELSINVKDFLSLPCPDPIQENDMKEAMVSLTNATRSFLAKPRKGSSISSLHLKLYLINTGFRSLEFVGFRSVEQQFTFIGSMLEQSPNLQKIILKRDEACAMCEALDVPSKFPKNDDREMVVRRIRDGTFLPQVTFDE